MLIKFFYGEVIKEEKLGRGTFGPTYKARFKEDIAIKKIFQTRGMKQGKNFRKWQKYWKLSIILMYLTLKMYITSHSLVYLNMYQLAFPRLEKFLKLMDWIGF